MEAYFKQDGKDELPLDQMYIGKTDDERHVMYLTFRDGPPLDLAAVFSIRVVSPNTVPKEVTLKCVTHPWAGPNPKNPNEYGFDVVSIHRSITSEEKAWPISRPTTPLPQ